MIRQTAIAALWSAVLAVSAPAAFAVEDLPAQLENVDITQKLGSAVPQDLEFKDHTGATVRLGDLVTGDVPTLLTLNYFECTMLCSVQLNALLEGLKELSWTPGDNFRVVTVSFDHDEGPKIARGKRDTLLGALDKRQEDGSEPDWSFLTGSQDNIKELADAVGFSFRYIPDTGEWAHPAAAMFLTPDGEVARYLAGLSYGGRDLRLALLEAGQGTIGSPIDQLFLSCFHYDDITGQYAPAIWGIMRLGSAMSVVAIGGAALVLYRREDVSLPPSDDHPPSEVT